MAYILQIGTNLTKMEQRRTGEENEQMGVGLDWVRFDVEKEREREYDGEEDEVLWSHHPKKQH